MTTEFTEQWLPAQDLEPPWCDTGDQREGPQGLDLHRLKHFAQSRKVLLLWSVGVSGFTVHGQNWWLLIKNRKHVQQYQSWQ